MAPSRSPEAAVSRAPDVADGALGEMPASSISRRSVDHRSVAYLIFGIIVEGFADGISFLNERVDTFKGLGKPSFERRLTRRRFCDERGEPFVARGFALSPNLIKLGTKTILRDPLFFQKGEFRLGRTTV